MLKSGTTAFVESMIAGRYGFDGIAEVVERSGIRAGLSKIVMDLPSYATAAGSMYPGMIEDPSARLGDPPDPRDAPGRSERGPRHGRRPQQQRLRHGPRDALGLLHP